MPTNTIDSTLTQLSSITRKYFFKDLADQITIANPLLAQKKMSMETVDGGDDLRVPIEISFNTSSLWYSGADTLLTANNDPFFAAIFPWAQLNVAITIPKGDILKNAGSSKVVDITKAKTDNARKTVMDTFGTGIYNSGTDPKAIVGSRVFLSASNTYGGLSQSTESYWQAKVDTTTTTLSLSAMQTRYEAASEPPIKPNLITCTETIFNSYHALLTPIQRFQDPKTASGGFENILFRGAPVIQDSYAPTSFMVFWNTDYVNVYSHSQRNFPGEFIDFDMPVNQDVAVGHLRWMGQFICKAPRFQGALTAITG